MDLCLSAWTSWTPLHQQGLTTTSEEPFLKQAFYKRGGKYLGSSEPALSTTELTQQQQPCCTTFGACFSPPTKSILNQFITPPAAFFTGEGQWVQMLWQEACAAIVSCNLWTQAYQKTQRTYKNHHQISPYSCTMHGRWVVKSNGKHNLGSKKKTYATRSGIWARVLLNSAALKYKCSLIRWKFSHRWGLSSDYCRILQNENFWLINWLLILYPVMFCSKSSSN